MLCGARPKFQSMLHWMLALHSLRLGLTSYRYAFIVASVPTAALMYIYIYIHTVCMSACGMSVYLASVYIYYTPQFTHNTYVQSRLGLFLGTPQALHGV